MKHTVLIIDDDELILNTLKQRFATWDIDVCSANSPDEAMEVLRKNKPEVVLLDLMLTKEDGSGEILDFMRREPSLEHIPVLILTNLDKPELKQQLLGQGVKEYIIKGSIALDDLYDKVLGYLEPEKASSK